MSVRHHPARGIFLFLACLSLLPLGARGDWETALQETDYPAREFSQNAFLTIMRDILSSAQEQFPEDSLSSPEIYPGADVDLDTLVSIRIPELSALQALEYAGRRAGFQVKVMKNEFQITRTPPRNATQMRKLEEALALQNLLRLALKQPDEPVEYELLDYAGFLLQEAKLLRLGTPESGRTPVEYAALQLILRSEDPTSTLLQLLPESRPAGFFYLAAGLQGLGLKPENPDFDEQIPILVEGGNLIVLESSQILYQEQIVTGKLWSTIQGAVSAQAP